MVQPAGLGACPPAAVRAGEVSTKDAGADRTRRGPSYFFGFTAHVAVDLGSDLIRDAVLTGADFGDSVAAEAGMTCFAGLDGSNKATPVCVLDGDERILRKGIEPASHMCSPALSHAIMQRPPALIADRRAAARLSPTKAVEPRRPDDRRGLL